jgi:hypothetical protein
MERWYIAFNTVGSPYHILNKLEHAVRQHQLGDFVVRFCCERGAGRRRGQFYVFIGVASEQKGIIPSEIYHEFYTLLQRLKLHDNNLYVYFDDVKKMVTKELEIHNLRQIKRLRLDKLEPSDPFNYASKESIQQRDIDLNDAYNKLLYWMSAYGRGTWQQFRMACKELGLDPSGEHSRRIMRRLRSLGHVELTRDGQNWLIAPTCLIETGADARPCCTFLAGQRSPALLRTLKDSTYTETEPQPYGDAPETVRVTFTSREHAENLIHDLSPQHHPVYLAGQAGLKIASTLPDLVSWEAHLPVLSVVKGYYTYEQWLNDGFYPIELPRETGLYRLTHVATHFDHPQLTLFYDSERDTWRKGDWYGLRYLMLRRTGQTCEFHYDHNLSALSISLDHRLPDLYERSLVLASGRLPIFRYAQVIFGGVPETLAHILANKLEAEFIEYRGI